MNSFTAAMILIIVLGALYATGYIKLGGVISLYKRIRLAALLWVAVILLIAAGRIFDFP